NDHGDRAAGHARAHLEVLGVVVRADEPAALVMLDVVLDAGATGLDDLGNRRRLARVEDAPLAGGLALRADQNVALVVRERERDEERLVELLVDDGGRRALPEPNPERARGAARRVRSRDEDRLAVGGPGEGPLE